ncbi:hypothetical protein GZL_08558 [Streptomyces sp. 769]|nr:hypothetical protein GZL_08558 [Streptomyces sp. 769]
MDVTDDEQRLAALFDTLPGYSEPNFWRGVKAAAGLARIRSTMSFAVREAAKDNFEPLARLALDAFGQDARHEALVDALAERLGGTLQARAWITDAVAAAGRIKRTGSADPLGALIKKW